ncbi:MAG: SRPBCC family protein [Thermodesulfobacteriota bacterium]|nr:SRPBCC family protein [Thermodesulfobacteriota bacterium]
MYPKAKAGIFVICLIVLCGAETWAARGSSDEQKIEALEKGEILTEIKQHPLTKVYLPTGQALVEASVQEIWWIITDFDSFGKFLPHTEYYRPVGWEKDRLLVDCKVKVAFMGFKYRLAYNISEQDHTSYWSYVSGPIHDAQGYWRVEPYDDTRVLVTYTTTMDVGRAMPGFIEKILAKSTFPDIFNSLRSRVKELRLQGPIEKPVLLPRTALEEANP